MTPSSSRPCCSPSSSAELAVAAVRVVRHHVCVTQRRPPTSEKLAARRIADLEHNQRVREQRMTADAKRDPAENLREGIALIRFAHRFAGAAHRGARG